MDCGDPSFGSRVIESIFAFRHEGSSALSAAFFCAAQANKKSTAVKVIILIIIFL
jgi:hypothetical protein